AGGGVGGGAARLGFAQPLPAGAGAVAAAARRGAAGRRRFARAVRRHGLHRPRLLRGRPAAAARRGAAGAGLAAVPLYRPPPLRQLPPALGAAEVLRLDEPARPRRLVRPRPAAAHLPRGVATPAGRAGARPARRPRLP